MKKIYTVLLFFICASASFAQVDAYSEDVKKCVKSNGTMSYYEDVMEQMYDMLKVQFTDENVPEAVWAEIKKGKQDAMDELAQMIVSAYRGHFTHEDVKNMNNLYASKAGKNMFKKDALTEGDKVVLNEFYKSDTGQKILGSQDSMNESMSKISEMWSSGVYRGVIAQLSEKGYNL
ncbi:hypothetical protein CLV86_0598 [Lacinutrix venerupis]|uniref:DUF2059 domain-containing protein n=1 Tax=Lacinutrix venerupis TaxID=1486034 RepID=A0AAC9LNT5_9FLAO|nr:DUF2059 domain-containing protein [Lacinutrix venerupis]APY00920.1 hypothetical protein BWR22_11580 [Lacinutrix venerupis]RLJ67114.1 hypothetical protein CLV86_0598 [Lacinutrix venerupis]